MKDFRLIICIDIAAPECDGDLRKQLKAAYGYMHGQLERCEFAWETSDEWFDNDDADHPGNPDVLNSAICDFFVERGAGHD